MKNTTRLRKFIIVIILLLTMGCAFLPTVAFNEQPDDQVNSAAGVHDQSVGQNEAIPTRMTPIIITPIKPVPPTPEPGADEIIATNPDQFVLASGGLQFLTFFTTWCDTCHAMAPVINSLAEVYGDRITFVALDLDDSRNNAIAALLSHGVIPEYYLLDENGDVLGTWIGETPSNDFSSAFEGALGN
ncbi:MAG TPA: thioredoxin domain-containing protein [Longilinea sp.]|nr:thioredoxin domain-containing protein [Longilinea sp.]